MFHEVEDLPGDAQALETNANRLQLFAEALERADTFLRTTANGEFNSSAAKSIDALKEQANSIGEQYANACAQYVLCAKGLARYAMTLDWVQRDMAPIVEEYRELDDLGTLHGPGATVDDDELPEGMSTSDVQERKAELQAEYNALYEEWHTAFTEAVTLIGAGIGISAPDLDEPSGWEKALDWLAIGGAVLAIVALWWNPAGWGVGAAALGTVGIQGYRYSQGDASLLDLAEAGAGAIPFGKFYKLTKLPDGSYQITPGKGLNVAKTSGLSDEALETFGDLSPQTQLLLMGAAYGDIKTTYDGMTGAVTSTGDIVHENRKTGERVEFDGIVEREPESSGSTAKREPPDRSTMGPAR
ncbi:hypothetical protein IM660_11995 [Ruania alkalisoli]|uniref:Uncharacterized protein n=1 Tax=Ruania alkalisoli TaxID=2779775 RepID=A0A7M1SQI0_9MICO|nr:hypothetical protein [Ruania alkalisoli]QOR69417.1 hypothetical protein IM660_11995 [Ruania alkalisoli]